MKMNTYWRLNSLCSFPPQKKPQILYSWILTEKRLSMCVCTRGFFSILLKDKSKILRRLTFELFAFVASVWPLVARWKKSPRRRDLPKLFAIVLSATRQRFNGKVSFPSFFGGGLPLIRLPIEEITHNWIQMRVAFNEDSELSDIQAEGKGTDVEKSWPSRLLLVLGDFG